MITEDESLKLNQLEDQLGVKFNDKKLLKQALIHRSYINELKKKEYRIGIASGATREKCIYGALVSGACNVLVTDEVTATRMLEGFS